VLEGIGVALMLDSATVPHPRQADQGLMKMQLTYLGNRTEGIVGKLVGPNKEGQLYEAVRAEYISLSNQTIVSFELLTVDDSRSAKRDGFGEAFVLAEAIAS
jgi:hypothetical protein